MTRQTNKKTYIIAEAGVNHNGSLDTAKKMIDAAASAGADAVKFQAFKAENLASISAPKAEYQKKCNEDESQYEMLKRLELDFDAHKCLLEYANEKGIDFLSSPFDIESIDMLSNLGLKTFKIPSGEITNLPYLRKLGRLNKKIIISSGMSSLEEIKKALDVLIKEGTQKEKIMVLHCNTAYPTPDEDVNLRAMEKIENYLGVSVGYSDHTEGIKAAVTASSLSAVAIEKHFTLDKDAAGPDHKASLDPREFGLMVNEIRDIEKILGSEEKKVSPSEKENIIAVRKSITAVRDIKEGEIFKESNITTKRPGSGLSPMKWDEVIGNPAKRDFKKDEMIEI